jgi:hypothetical protein
VIDLRAAQDPERELERLRARGPLLVWGREGEPAGLPAAAAAPTLAVWTVPGSPADLRALVEQYAPAEVALFGNLPPDPDPDALLRRLVGLLKYAVRAYEGRIEIEQLAADTLQPRAVVEAALEYLAQRGMFALDRHAGEVRAVEGSGRPVEGADESAARLKQAFAEAQAFRRFLLGADLERLFAKADWIGEMRET